MKHDKILDLMDIMGSDPDGLYNAIKMYTYSDEVYEDDSFLSSNFECGYSIWTCVDVGESKTRTVTLSNGELLGMYRKYTAMMAM